MLAGIYYGAQYGGSTTSIPAEYSGRSLLRGHLPGWLSDGPSGESGAGPGHVGFRVLHRRYPERIRLMLMAPPMANMALKFGFAENFSLMCLGL